MPIYEFVCQSCGNEFEQIRSFSDNSVPTCSACQSEQVVRRLGRPAIHFKGSGWYITDSKKTSKESAVGTSSPGTEKKAETPAAETASTTTAASKSESKSEPAKAAAE